MNYGTFVLIKGPPNNGVEYKLANRDCSLWLELAVEVAIEPFQFAGVDELDLNWDSWHIGGELYGCALNNGCLQNIEKVSDADYAKFHRAITPDKIYGVGEVRMPHLQALQKKYPGHLAVAVLTHS